MDIGDRIRSERERLGFKQADFAALGGASKNSQLAWEKGHAMPNAGVLAEYAKAGADVLYILTGQRSVPVAPQALLPEGDRILLDNFHAAPPGVQVGVKTTLGAFAPVGSSTAKKRRA